MDISRLPSENKNNLWFKYTKTDSVIIFVHGVLSGSRSCWLYDDKRHPANSAYWPELIDKDGRFANIAIYLGGYHTSVDAGDYEVSNCVDELFAALKRAAKGRPPPLAFSKITFVCHSMGGIVARSLLERHSDDFMKKSIGLVLIASPTYGSEYANSLEWLIRFFNNQQGMHLRWGSWSLEDLDDRFRKLQESRKITGLRGVEFYENHFIIHRKWMPFLSRKPIVSKRALGRYFGAPKQIPDSDHFTICKPKSSSAVVHQYLYDFLHDCDLLPTSSDTRKIDHREVDSATKGRPAYPIADSTSHAMAEMSVGQADGDKNWLMSIKDYPAVLPHEIPYEVIEIFAQAFPTETGAKAFILHSVNALRLHLNPEGNTARQILISAPELPVSQNQMNFWTEVLTLAGGKSRRTLAAFTVAPNAPVPERYGPHYATIYKQFQSRLVHPIE